MAAGAALLARLFGEPAPPEDGPEPDGTVTVLEAHALAAPDLAGAEPPGSAGRRQRTLALPAEVVQESLGAKVLHAWLQNRHQTLYPLTVNLRTLEAERAALLARVMALSLLAGTGTPGEARVAAALAWLGEVGGDESVARALRAALDAPAALSALVREVEAAKMAPLAYVAALVASDSRDEAGQRFLDYLATRLALPANVVRSADRRYRRQLSASVSAVSAP